jgi:excisionase family DNA binding protein
MKKSTDSKILAELRRIRTLLEKAVANVPTDSPRLMTVNQTAAYLTSSVWAVRQLHWSQTLRAIMIGRRLLFDRSDVDSYVEALKKASRF